MDNIEYSANEIRVLLQDIFPNRQLVLSQFTFFNQIGVSRPTGVTFKRGRRCYRLEDILSIACVIALKEEGIPFKNIEHLPAIIQENVEDIFFYGPGCRVSGFGDFVFLKFPYTENETQTFSRFLNSSSVNLALFWSYDLGELAWRLKEAAINRYQEQIEEFPILKAA